MAAIIFSMSTLGFYASKTQRWARFRLTLAVNRTIFAYQKCHISIHRISQNLKIQIWISNVEFEEETVFLHVHFLFWSKWSSCDVRSSYPRSWIFIYQLHLAKKRKIIKALIFWWKLTAQKVKELLQNRTQLRKKMKRGVVHFNTFYGLLCYGSIVCTTGGTLTLITIKNIPKSHLSTLQKCTKKSKCHLPAVVIVMQTFLSDLLPKVLID